MKKDADNRRNIYLVRRWLTAALAVALLLTTAMAPKIDLYMKTSAHAMAGEVAPVHMANAMGAMVDPCCDGCDDTETKACENSALCMTACGKLPLQLVTATGFVLTERAVKAVREPDVGRPALFPSPLRRPPKEV